MLYIFFEQSSLYFFERLKSNTENNCDTHKIKDTIEQGSCTQSIKDDNSLSLLFRKAQTRLQWDLVINYSQTTFTIFDFQTPENCSEGYSQWLKIFPRDSTSVIRQQTDDFNHSRLSEREESN